MTRRQFYVALTVMAVSGMIGGALATWLLPGRAVYAQQDGVEVDIDDFEINGDPIQPAQVVRAQRFVLVDRAGEERASLGLIDGDPGLALADDAGNTRTALGVIDDMPKLGLFDDDSEAGARLFLLDGEPWLELADAAGRPRVVLGSTATEHTRTGAATRYPISTITLYDETGHVRWQAP